MTDILQSFVPLQITSSGFHISLRSFSTSAKYHWCFTFFHMLYNHFILYVYVSIIFSILKIGQELKSLLLILPFRQQLRNPTASHNHIHPFLKRMMKAVSLFAISSAILFKIRVWIPSNSIPFSGDKVLLCLSYFLLTFSLCLNHQKCPVIASLMFSFYVPHLDSTL